jgi:indole-3-glycerol phosphate synthase
MLQLKLENKNSINKFSRALWKHYGTGKLPVIPDIKLRSPGEGDLLREKDSVEYARALTAAGAPVLSVVTEPEHFGGSGELLQKLALSVPIPILRKDFINNKDQLIKSADLGASAILLIASMLERRQLLRLIEGALMVGLEPLVETHSAEEIASINGLGLSMIGINNRNIAELELDDGCVGNTERLAGLISSGSLIISESSISSPRDVQRALIAGAHAVLVGTAILKADNPVDMYNSLSQVRIEGL